MIKLSKRDLLKKASSEVFDDTEIEYNGKKYHVTITVDPKAVDSTFQKGSLPSWGYDGGEPGEPSYFDINLQQEDCVFSILDNDTWEDAVLSPEDEIAIKSQAYSVLEDSLNQKVNDSLLDDMSQREDDGIK